MTEPDRPVDIERRIAKAQAARTPVDSQGRPKRKPTVYTYDADGLLVTATAALDSE